MDEVLARLLQAQRQFHFYTQCHAVLPLFHFLEGLQLNVPDTLLYRGPYLESWYYTDEGGRVVRRLPHTLSEGAEEEVVGAFTRRTPNPGAVVALWIEVGEGVQRRSLGEEGGEEEGRRRRRKGKNNKNDPLLPPLDIVYLTESGLREKLVKGRGGLASESSMAILQRFVIPKGPQNHVIRAQWTPGEGLVSALCTASPAPWLDATAPLALRFATIDALPTQSPPPTTTPLTGTTLPATIRDALVGLADHVSSASLHAARPVSMDTLWKLGGDGKLYFMLAMGVGLEGSREVDRAMALMQRICPEGEGGTGGLSARVGSPGVSLRPPRPHPRPFTATLAQQSESLDRASPMGVSSYSVRATNQGLLVAAEAAQRAALAETVAREAEEERVREERYHRALLLTDVRAVKKHFNRATQCPGCGMEFTEVPAIQRTLPPGCSKGQTLIAMGALVTYHETVLYAFAREPFIDSVRAAIWTGTAFDSPAAAAMAPQPGLHFLPPTPTLKLGTGGGVGYYGAVLLNPPAAPPEKVVKEEVKKAASPSVFKPQLPIPEFRIQDEERRLRMADTIKARDAKAKAAVTEASTNAALEILNYMELLRAKVGVPEIPPPLSLLQPSLTPVAYRALKRDLYFTRELSHVCNRCQCVMASVNKISGGLERIPYWLREGALMAAVEEGVERYEKGVVAHKQWEEGVEEEGRRDRERARHPPPTLPLLTGLGLLMSAGGRGRVEEVVDGGLAPSPPTLDDSTLRLLTKELHSKLSLTTIQTRVEKEHLLALTKGLRGGDDSESVLPPRLWLEGVLVGEGGGGGGGGGVGGGGDGDVGNDSDGGGGDSTPDSGGSLASPPQPLTILPPSNPPLQILPSLQRVRNGGKNPLYPASIFPKPEGYVPTSPLTSRGASSATNKSPSLPPLTAPTSPILHSATSPKPPLHPSGSFSSDTSSLNPQQQQQAHPSSPSSLPLVSPIGSIMERFCLANGLPSPLLNLRGRSTEGDAAPPPPPTVALPAYVDDSVGEWSYEGFTQPNPDTGFIAVGCVRMGGERSHPYIAMIRKAHECELKGMVWRVKRGEAPVEGFEATPFALHLVSCRSGRGVVEWLRVWDMRKRINPMVLKALAWAEGGGGEATKASAAGEGSGGRPPPPSPSLTFLPPPSLMHTVVLQAFLPKSGRRGVERGESTVLKRVGKTAHIPPSVFLHDTPATTLPMPPPHTASRTKHIPSSFHFNLLLAAMPDTAAMLPDTFVPPSTPLSELVERGEVGGRGGGAGGGVQSLLPSLTRPYMDVPRSHAATRGALCTHTQALYSPLRQPLFLLRRFSPSSGKVHTEKVGEEGGGGNRVEAWLTFAQLCAPHRSVHPAVLYAARCRLLAFAGHSHDSREVYGFRFFPAVCGSLPSQGAVQRLIPGHFMGGRGGLDKARGFVHSHTSPAEASLSSLHLKRQTQEALLAFKEWNANNRELQALLALEDGKEGGGGEEKVAVEEGKEEGGEGLQVSLHPSTPTPTAITLKPTPAMQAIIPRPRAALRMQEMRPVDIKSALEMMDSSPFSTAEKEFWEGGEALGGGLLARRLVERRDGSMLHCQMWGGFPEEVGKSGAMKEAERKAQAEFVRSKGRGDPLLLARISNQGAGINARFQYRVRLFASNTRVVTSRWVEPGDMLRPLRDPHAFDEPLDPDAPFPGNPFLDTEGHLACCGIPLAAREAPIATRVCSGKDIQTWVARGEVLGSLEQARGDPYGPHASVPLGGVYLLSLWMRPAKHIPGVGGEEAPLEEGHLQGVAKGATAWEWDEEDEGHPLRADENTTLTMVQSYAYVGGDAGHIHRQAPPRRGLPRFTLRAQYLRQPLPAWEPPLEYDHRVSQESGVRMSARMATAEFKHWAVTGNFPSSARLPTILTAEPVFNTAFPKVKFQLHGTALPWVEPCYAYAATLEDLGLTMCNPFLEALPSFK